VLEQREQGVVDQVPGRLVAGDDERDEEEVELEVVEALAVELGLDQRGHEVVAGVGPAVLGDLVAQRVDLRRGRAASTWAYSGSSGADQVVRDLEHPGPQLGLEADHLADHLHRDLGGDVLDELALPPRSITSSMTASARRSISSTSLAIMRGVNAFETSRRARLCCGGSMLRIDRRSCASASSSWVGMKVAPSSLEYVSQSWLTRARRRAW
jgi:hypothetical protein